MYGIFINGKLAKDRRGKDVVVESYSLADKFVGVCAKRGIHATIKVWEEEASGGAWVDLPTANPSEGMRALLYGPAYQPAPVTRAMLGIWRDY